MSDDSDRQSGNIQPPKTHHGADIGRAAAKGVLGAVPVAGSFLTEAADLALPDPTERDRRRWEGEVTDGVNSLHGRVDGLEEHTGFRAVTFSGALADIARFMIERCPDGLARDDVTVADIQDALPGLGVEEITDGLAQLGSYELICATEFLNGDAFYTLTEASYEALDPPIMGWSPADDARQVANAAVSADYQDGIVAGALEQSLGWPRRRFNPALRMVLGLIDPSCVDDTLQQDHVAAGFYLSNVDRARLKRFAAGQ